MNKLCRTSTVPHVGSRMSLNKPAHVIAFVIVLGFVAYLTSALWSAIFIVSLPMAEDAIVDAIELQTGEDDYEWRPVEFKNGLEEVKYYHNVRMRDRNRYWVYGLMIVGGAIGLFVFYVVPKWRSKFDKERDTTGIAIGGAVIGVLVVLIVPRIIGWVLPAPVKWFPQEIVDIAETRQKEALERLEPLAREIDAERRFDDP